MKDAHLPTHSGECGTDAIAINHTIFDGLGTYVVSVDNSQCMNEDRINFVEHVGVLYNGRIYDGEGAISKRDFRYKYSYDDIEFVDLDNAGYSREESEELVSKITFPTMPYDLKVKRLEDALAKERGRR